MQESHLSSIFKNNFRYKVFLFRCIVVVEVIHVDNLPIFKFCGFLNNRFVNIKVIHCLQTDIKYGITYVKYPINCIISTYIFPNEIKAVCGSSNEPLLTIPQALEGQSRRWPSLIEISQYLFSSIW